MKERTIRLLWTDWDFHANEYDKVPGPVREKVLHRMASALDGSDVNYHRFVGEVVLAMRNRVEERRRDPEHKSRSDTDLLVSFTISEETWKLKLGSLQWVQPRPNV